MAGAAASKTAAATTVPSLASIYRAKKSGESVEEMRLTFQSQMKNRLSAPKKALGSTRSDHIIHDSRLAQAPNLVRQQHDLPKPNNISATSTSRVSGSNELNYFEKDFKRLQREKSFEEARIAVQSQMERIFRNSLSDIRQSAVSSNCQKPSSHIMLDQSDLSQFEKQHQQQQLVTLQAWDGGCKARIPAADHLLVNRYVKAPARQNLSMALSGRHHHSMDNLSVAGYAGRASSGKAVRIAPPPGANQRPRPGSQGQQQLQHLQQQQQQQQQKQQQQQQMLQRMLGSDQQGRSGPAIRRSISHTSLQGSPEFYLTKKPGSGQWNDQLGNCLLERGLTPEEQVERFLDTVVVPRGPEVAAGGSSLDNDDDDHDHYAVVIKAKAPPTVPRWWTDDDGLDPEEPFKPSSRRNDPHSRSPYSRQFPVKQDHQVQVDSPDRMSTGSDLQPPGHLQGSESGRGCLRGETPDDDDYGDDHGSVVSCSCTDVTLDENNRIIHKHKVSSGGSSSNRGLDDRNLNNGNVVVVVPKEGQDPEQQQKQQHRWDDPADKSGDRGGLLPGLLPGWQPPQKIEEPANCVQFNLGGDDYSRQATQVEYLGSVPMSSHASDLMSLQQPLRKLYFKYLKIRDSLSPDEASMQGSVEITKTGLKILYVQGQKVVRKICNPFPTIAVWAAVRFAVVQAKGGGGAGAQGHDDPDLRRRRRRRYFGAFLPLISDPGEAEKRQLFSEIPTEDRDLLQRVVQGMDGRPRGQGTPRDPEGPPSSRSRRQRHPAMFACIMRSSLMSTGDHGFPSGGAKAPLEGHVFVCRTQADAISIAAQLYQALVETIRRSNAAAISSGKNSCRLRLTRCSSVSMGSVTSYDDRGGHQQQVGGLQHPYNSNNNRNNNKTDMDEEDVFTSDSAMKDDDDLSGSTARVSMASGQVAGTAGTGLGGMVPPPAKSASSIVEQSMPPSGYNSFQTTSTNNNNSNTKVRISSSEEDDVDDKTSRPAAGLNKALSSMALGGDDDGQLLAMPRSRSCVNVSLAKVEVGAIEGKGRRHLQELFRELRDKNEGVSAADSVADDILRQVVKSDGMSFNGIQPVYRELLLELATSMSRDEMFIRSRNIMNEDRIMKKKRQQLLVVKGSSSAKSGPNHPATPSSSSKLGDLIQRATAARNKKRTLLGFRFKSKAESSSPSSPPTSAAKAVASSSAVASGDNKDVNMKSDNNDDKGLLRKRGAATLRRKTSSAVVRTGLHRRGVQGSRRRPRRGRRPSSSTDPVSKSRKSIRNRVDAGHLLPDPSAGGAKGALVGIGGHLRVVEPEDPVLLEKGPRSRTGAWAVLPPQGPTGHQSHQGASEPPVVPLLTKSRTPPAKGSQVLGAAVPSSTAGFQSQRPNPYENRGQHLKTVPQPRQLPAGHLEPSLQSWTRSSSRCSTCKCCRSDEAKDDRGEAAGQRCQSCSSSTYRVALHARVGSVVKVSRSLEIISTDSGSSLSSLETEPGLPGETAWNDDDDNRQGGFSGGKSRQSSSGSSCISSLNSHLHQLTTTAGSGTAAVSRQEILMKAAEKFGQFSSKGTSRIVAAAAAGQSGGDQGEHPGSRRRPARAIVPGAGSSSGRTASCTGSNPEQQQEDLVPIRRRLRLDSSSSSSAAMMMMRGLRHAYSDANMQMSLGYLP